MLREDFAAPPLARFAVEVEDLRAPVELEPAPDDFARVDEDFLAAPLERDELFAAPPLERFAVELEPEDLRAPLERPELLRDAEEAEPELVLALPSIDHLPDITR